MGVSGFQAAGASVLLSAEVSGAMAGMGEVQGAFGRTVESGHRMVGELSLIQEAALKAEIAQKRYAVALAKTGADSIRTRSALLAMSRAQREYTLETTRSTQELGKLERGGLAASGMFHGMGRSVAFASSAFLGGYGLISVLRTTINAATGYQAAIAQVQRATLNSGQSWVTYGKQVREALSAQERATAFTETQLAGTLPQFIRRYGDVNQALKANALAADVARARNIDLSVAARLVERATFGVATSARRLDIVMQPVHTNYELLRATLKHATADQIAHAKALDQAATATSVMTAIQDKYGKSAAAWLQTTAGKQALFHAELEHTQRIIGEALLPEMNKLFDALSKYVEKLDKSGQLQRDAKTISHDLSVAVHDLGVAWHLLEPILHAVTNLLGGTGHAVSLLLEIMVARKVLTFATALKSDLGGALLALKGNAAVTTTAIEGVGTAQTVAATETATAATEIGVSTKAMQVAYTGVGTAAGTAATEVGAADAAMTSTTAAATGEVTALRAALLRLSGADVLAALATTTAGIAAIFAAPIVAAGLLSTKPQHVGSVNKGGWSDVSGQAGQIYQMPDGSFVTQSPKGVQPYSGPFYTKAGKKTTTAAAQQPSKVDYGSVKGDKSISSTYFAAVLSSMGLKPTVANIDFLNAWANREGVPQSVDPFNLLGTTQSEPGSHPTNTAGVQAYASMASGITATASMLSQGNFAAIRAALASGDPSTLRNNPELQREFRLWSGGGYSWPTGSSNPRTVGPGGGGGGGGGGGNPPATGEIFSDVIPERLQHQLLLAYGDPAAENRAYQAELDWLSHEYKLATGLYQKDSILRQQNSIKASMNRIDRKRKTKKGAAQPLLPVGLADALQTAQRAYNAQNGRPAGPAHGLLPSQQVGLPAGGAARVQLEQALAAADKYLAGYVALGVTDTISQARHDAADKLLTSLSNKLNKLLAADKAKKKASHGIPGLDVFELAVLQDQSAVLTAKTPAGLLAAKKKETADLTKEEKFLQHYMQSGITTAQKLAAQRILNSVESQLKKLVTATLTIAQLQALQVSFLQQQVGFFASFGSNVFTQQAGPNGTTVRTPGSDKPTVTVVQHITAPTQNRMREAAYAKHAAVSVWDG